MLVTTHRAHTVRGIGAGDGSSAVRRAFPHARRWFRLGATRILLVRPTVLVAVRRGRVRALAVRDPRRVRGARATRTWLRRAI